MCSFSSPLIASSHLAQAKGEFHTKRGRQQRNWMWKLLREELLARFEAHPRVRELLPPLEEKVRLGRIAASAAADQLLREFLGSTLQSAAYEAK